ncbi:golgin subfamily A member 6-like protein 4 [Prorops nasuta]|uniref:golgin subfamily A member 6-like protein 4 n=1 Tax=Prorops nasuta TaxID=863751 RepID=UPI0034D00432
MSERTIVEKSEKSSVLNSLGNVPELEIDDGERILRRCGRRKLLNSQPPIKCQKPTNCHPYYRPSKNPTKKDISAYTQHSPSNCTIRSCPTSTPSSSSPCILDIHNLPTSTRRSLSLIDLSSLISELDNTDVSSCGSLQSSRSSFASEKDMGNLKMTRGGYLSANWIENCEKREKHGEDLVTGLISGEKAANIVCRVLMLNAWRRRREEVNRLQDSAGSLHQQVEDLRIQIVVLRRLLESEKQRVGKLGIDLHRTKSMLDETSIDRDRLKSDKERLDEELERVTEQSQQRFVDVENLRNEMQTAQDQLRALETQLSKEREKLLKLREDKRILLDKVAASDALANERELKAEKAEIAVEQLQMKLAAQIAMLQSSQEENQRYFREARDLKEDKLVLERRLEMSEARKTVLSLRISDLERELNDRDAELRSIRLAYSTQSVELRDLKERLVRQSEEGRWSSRMLQLAGSVVRAPRAILRTLSFLSTTSVSLPS